MQLAESPKEADVVVFIGGVDIDPSIYGQPAHSSVDYTEPTRDQYEMTMFNMAAGKLKVGICRGAQLLNVLSGGSLIQHVEGHRGGHDIVVKTEGNTVFRNVISTHHQMMLPSPVVTDRTILAVAHNKNTSVSSMGFPYEMEKNKYAFLGKYKSEDFNPFNEDLEIVYYKNTDSLCIQTHPERMGKTPFNGWCNELICQLALDTRKKTAQSLLNFEAKKGA